MVIECVPAPIAAAVTEAVGIPTIGIGAGPACSGQVLVFHDLLGMMSHPHHAQVRRPQLCCTSLLQSDNCPGCLHERGAHDVV